MKKTIIAVCVLYLFLGFRGEVSGQEESDFTWTPNGGRGGRQWVTITGYSGAGKVITIPPLTPHGPIEVIGPRAFEKKGLTTLTLSEDVKRIEDYACAENRLTQIAIPLSATFIGNGAFMRNQFTSLTLPGGLMEVGDNAFRGNQLRTVTIPVDEITIGSGAFIDNPITKIVIGNNAYLEADSFPNDFASIYESHEMTGGSYTFSGGKWYAESEMAELLAAQEAAGRLEAERQRKLALQRELEQELAALGRLPPLIKAEQERQQDLRTAIGEEQEQKDRMQSDVYRERNTVEALNRRLHAVDEGAYDEVNLVVTSQFDFTEYLKALPQFKYRGLFDAPRIAEGLFEDISITMEGKAEYLIYNERETVPENEKFLYLRLKEAINFQVNEKLFFEAGNYNYINAPGYLEEIISDSAGRPSYAFNTGAAALGIGFSHYADWYRIAGRGSLPAVYDSSIERIGFGASGTVSLYPVSSVSLTGTMSWNSLDYSRSSGDLMNADGLNFSADIQYRSDLFVIGADWLRNSKQADKYGIKLGIVNLDIIDLDQWSVFVDLLKDEYDVSEFGINLNYSSDTWGFWIRGMHYESDAVSAEGWGVRCALELKF